MWSIKNILFKRNDKKIQRICFLLLLSVWFLMFQGCKTKEVDVSYDKEMLDELSNSLATVLFEGGVEEEKEIAFTTQVAKGDMIVEASNKGYLYYPNRYHISYTESNITANIVEVFVNYGDIIDKGDKIASISYNLDDIEVERKKVTVNRSKENLEYTKKEFDQELKLLKSSLTESTEEEKIVKELQYENRKREINDAIATLEENHQKVVEEANVYLDKLEVGYIVAPADGMITELEKLLPGDLLNPWRHLAIIDDLNEVYLAIDNENNQFRYNMEVSIKVTDRGNTKESEVEYYKGIVMTGNELLSWQLHTPKTYIRLLDGEIYDLVGKTILVTGKTKYLKDVLLVDKSAVDFAKRIPYVLEEINGETYRRNFVMGSSDSSFYTILDGLEAGETVRLGVSR